MYEHVDLFDYERLCNKHGSQKYADVTLETLEKYRARCQSCSSPSGNGTG